MLRGSVNDAFVEPADAVRYFSAARINLNIHKDSTGHAWDRNRRAIVARSPNERVFAIGGTGAFQLVDNSRPDLEAIFPGDLMATFDADDPRSLGDRVRHFLAHDGEREDKACRLRQLVLADHTYDVRIATVLSRL